MKLYDDLIRKTLALVEETGYRGISSRPTAALDGAVWPDDGGFSLILQRDMAFELGGGGLPAVSGLFFTSDAGLVQEDELCLLGPDLPELASDSPYARITLIRVAEGCFGGEQEAYDDLRKMEYTRYHVFPEGYMMRISAASMREPVRVSRKALAAGLSFEKVGQLFLQGYHSHPKVEAVKMLFITLPEFPYAAAEALARQGEAITSSLHRIFDNLVMDCSACSLKPVCDEVEGLRQLHALKARQEKDPCIEL